MNTVHACLDRICCLKAATQPYLKVYQQLLPSTYEAFKENKLREVVFCPPLPCKLHKDISLYSTPQGRVRIHWSPNVTYFCWLSARPIGHGDREQTSINNASQHNLAAFHKSYHLRDNDTLTSTQSSLYPNFQEQEELTETLDSCCGQEMLNTGTSPAQTMVRLRKRALMQPYYPGSSPTNSSGKTMSTQPSF